MKILIIGGSGTIAELALNRNHEVWSVTGGNRPLDKRIKALSADRQDPGAMEAVVTGENTMWDLVVDCICFEESHMLQDLALFPGRAKHFVFISSEFVYDPAKRLFPQPVDGEYCSEETNSYGWNKRRCEEALAKSDAGSMAWTILRPCHIYGPSSELGCFPLHGRDRELITKLRGGEKIRLAGGSHFLQQPILAKDLAETVLSIAGKSRAHGKVFNMAGPDITESRRYYRIYDLAPLGEAGLSVPATPLAEGLRLHAEGLLKTRGLT